MQAREAMSHPVITVRNDATVGLAARLLTGHGFTALPVTDEDGALVGIVSDSSRSAGREVESRPACPGAHRRRGDDLARRIPHPGSRRRRRRPDDGRRTDQVPAHRRRLRHCRHTDPSGSPEGSPCQGRPGAGDRDLPPARGSSISDLGPVLNRPQRENLQPDPRNPERDEHRKNEH